MAFIPLGDDNTDRVLTPWINWLLIALNIVVFVQVQRFGTNLHAVTSLATVPGEILSGRDIVTPGHVVEDPVSGERVRMPGLDETPIPVWGTLLTAMFLHGSLLHLLGNMLFLWVFGDNIENALGHFRYTVFYLVGGLLAGLAHVFSTAAFHGDLLVPSLGASGAISAVLGAYLLLYPRRRVRVLMVRFIIDVPAWLEIGLWFVFQVGSGLLMLGAQQGGVAYGAHVGGFVAGLVLIKPFMIGRTVPRVRWAR